MYSLLDGFGTPKEMLDRCTAIGIKAYAVTEHGNEYSWVYFDMLKKDYSDIKIIYGVELYECFDTFVQDKNNKYFHLIALAKNENGRKALNKIITKSNLENFYYKPRVQISDIAPFAQDLVICSACLASKIARESDYDKCVEYVEEYKGVFPHFYLEMQSHSSEDQARYNKKILQLAKDTNTDFIITTDSHAATKEDLYYQARHVQIAHDTETLTESYEGCYLQSEEEIHAIMDNQIGVENVNIGLENTNMISDMIDIVNMPFQSPQLPTYPLPESFDSNYAFLKHLISEGWRSRNFDKMSQEEQKIYKDRIDYELGIIHQMNFDGYFIIVWDFINYAKTHGVKVGSGRGSGAGSLVCFTIGITDLNPIKYGLIFERFLNPERISMPDLDIDVSDRQTVINYLVNKYGENRVCQIINFSFITPVVAIKDVGKVLGFKYADMDKLSKRFTYENFEECVENNREYLSDHPEYRELIDISGKLSGRVKTVSCHAGGVGIVDTDIDDYMAMKLGSKGEHVISVDKRVVEEIGIIKFDILGVQTLKMVQEIQNDLYLSEYDININNPDFENDKLPYELLNKALTNGVFQVESAGMKDLLLRLQATNMEDLSAVLALYRPDSMEALEEFIECKHDPSKVKYIHPDMKPILESTYGCCIAENERISTPSGLKKIQDITDRDIVYTYNGQEFVSKIWCNGKRPVHQLTLKNGKSITATGDHKFLTSRGWVALQDITIDDVVALKIGNKNTQTYDLNKLKIIGYLLGDGSFRQSNGVHFYNTNIKIIADFKAAVETAYRNIYVLVQGQDVPSGSYVYNCTLRSRIKYDRKFDFLSDINEWGLKGKLSTEKEIPAFIFALNTECILTVLGTYLDTDGSLTERGHIRYKTSSKQLALDVQELIRLVGFNSHIYSHSDKEYDICVYNSFDFYKILRPFSYKLLSVDEDKLPTVDKDMGNKFPLQFVKPYIDRYLKENKISGREAYKNTGLNIFRNYNSSRAKKYNCILFSTLLKLNKVFKMPDFWFNSNIMWVEIKEIKNLNRDENVYDIEVEEEHNFIVNGVVVHNCIYQEQLLDIVRKFGGRSYGKADLFRKAIGKKNVELVKQESAKLYQEIIDNGYSEDIAKTISDELSTKGGYLFNKSHSYSYAVLCFQTAYLKIKYPTYFYKALFNLNKDKAGMINKYILDSQQFNVSVLPPNINKSDINFSVCEDKVLFGLSAIAGIGENVANEIISVRTEYGKFKSFDDMLKRTDLTKAQIILLIKSGAIPTKNKKQFLINYLKSLYTPLTFKPSSKAPSYAELIDKCDMDIEQYRIGDKKYDYDKEAILRAYNELKYQEFRNNQEVCYRKYIDDNKKYLENERFWEFEALQIFINDNPFTEAYKYMTRQFEDVPVGEKCVIVGIISQVQKKKDKNKKQFAFINIYSSFGLVEGILWHTQLKEYEDLIKKGSQIAVKCKKDSEDRIVIERIKPYSQWLKEKGVI